MDSTIRLFTKAITWQAAGLVSMMLIGFLFTGSLLAGGGIAIVGCVVGFIAYFVHEMIWSRIAWGRGLPPAPTSVSGAASTHKP